MTSTSLLIATYKNTEFLELVLLSAFRQSYPLKEIIICEDGDFAANKTLIEKLKSESPFLIIHITQKDIGNRKPLCVNKGIAASTADYLVFIDGDCVLRNDFVADHVKLSGDDRFLTGRRVELSSAATKILSSEKIRQGYLDSHPWELYRDALFGDTQHFGRFFKTPFFMRELLGRNKILDIRGCNLSVHKKHLLAINGYNNEFSGAYGEDSDLEYRLKFLGLKMMGCKGAAIQFHLWHKTQTHDFTNQERLKKLLQDKSFYTENGLKEASGLA